MKYRGFSWLRAIVTMASLLLIGVVLWPALPHEGEGRRSVCQTNLKRIALAIEQYVEDYDERYPQIKANGPTFGWADSLQPYLKDTAVYQCPEEGSTPTEIDPRGIGYTDYWYNRNLSGLREDRIPVQAMTIMNGDGNDGTDATNARYNFNRLPTAWLTAPNSPIHRHFEGLNFAFADGHVKWLKPQVIKPLSSKGLSFSIQ